MRFNNLNIMHRRVKLSLLDLILKVILEFWNFIFFFLIIDVNYKTFKI